MEPRKFDVDPPPDLSELSETRAILDTLLAESKLYQRSADYRALLEFVGRLRNFAPFNAMLLHVQKPGLTYAAYAVDWQKRFGRWPKERARPLLILRPHGPVALVYDVMDTEGAPLPPNVDVFPAKGAIGQAEVATFIHRLEGQQIDCVDFDAGDAQAGAIRCVYRSTNKKERNVYRLFINRNHSAATQFVTLAHELAHLFLGHLGEDKARKIKDRSNLPHGTLELEAESVAYLVCTRYGVRSRSETYLANFVANNSTVDTLDIYLVMRATGKIEAILGLAGSLRSKAGT